MFRVSVGKVEPSAQRGRVFREFAPTLTAHDFCIWDYGSIWDYGIAGTTLAKRVQQVGHAKSPRTSHAFCSFLRCLIASTASARLSSNLQAVVVPLPSFSRANHFQEADTHQ